MAVAELHRGPHGVPRVRVGREADGSFVVEWAPPELDPFGLRYRWLTMVAEELEDGDPMKVVEWAAGPPEVIQPEPPAEWTLDHQRTLDEHVYAFRRYAEKLRRGRLLEAIDTRRESIAFDAEDYRRAAPSELPDAYLVALVREVAALKQDGWTLVQIASRRRLPMSLRTLKRRLGEARERGLSR